MAWHSHGHDQASLVDALERNGLVTTPAVAVALRRVDRGLFCAPNTSPYADAPQRTPYPGATISAPHMHAQCLELVARFVRRRAEEGEAGGPQAHKKTAVRVLDVGCGTGYLLAAFAHLCAATLSSSPSSSSLSSPARVEVVGVERLAPLARAARELLCSSRSAGGSGGGGGGRGGGGSRPPPPLLPSEEEEGVRVSVTVVEGDGHSGWEQGGPYDVIHVGAAISGGVPPALIEQLAPGGVLVAPLVDEDGGGQALWMLENGRLDGGGGLGEVRRTRVMPVVYVPLVKEAEGAARRGPAAATN